MVSQIYFCEWFYIVGVCSESLYLCHKKQSLSCFIESTAAPCSSMTVAVILVLNWSKDVVRFAIAAVGTWTLPSNCRAEASSPSSSSNQMGDISTQAVFFDVTKLLTTLAIWSNQNKVLCEVCIHLFYQLLCCSNELRL